VYQYVAFLPNARLAHDDVQVRQLVHRFRDTHPEWKLLDGSKGIFLFHLPPAGRSVAAIELPAGYGAILGTLFPKDLARMMALGANWCNSARGFMFALGCIQSQSCHTGHCPTGVATQDPQRARALVVTTKADRVYHFHESTLHALKELIQAAGLNHPSELTADHIVRRNSEQDNPCSKEQSSRPFNSRSRPRAPITHKPTANSPSHRPPIHPARKSPSDKYVAGPQTCNFEKSALNSKHRA